MASSHDVDRPSDSRPKSQRGRSAGASSRTRSRVWTFVLLAMLLAMFVSCCSCGVFIYRQWPSFQEDAGAAEDLTRQMLSIKIPEAFEPKGTVEWHVWLLLTMRGAYFAHTVDDGELTLLELDSRFISQPDFRRHIIDSLRQHGAGSGFDLNVLHSETKMFDVGNEQVPFEFLTAVDRTTGEERRLVDGVVTGRSGGPVLVSLWVDEDIWDEEMVTRLIESIGAAETP